MITKKRSSDVTSKYFKRSKTEQKDSHQTNLLEESFYDQECTHLAKKLLGQIIVRKVDGQTLRCRIVEVESYLAKDDKASHSYNHRQTKRNKAMFMKPGTLYVYMTYGIYCCMNISSSGPGNAVLIRAAEPVEGIDIMKANRSRFSKKSVEDKNISNGPSKMCQALQIDRNLDQIDLTNNKELWLEKGELIPSTSIVSCSRIGLSKKAEEWMYKPLRFYIIGNKYVSVKNKNAEAQLTES